MGTTEMDANRIEIERICRLDDTQTFYRTTLIESARKSAVRALAILHIAACDGSPVAYEILASISDTETLTQLFLQFREYDASAQGLVKSYTSGNSNTFERQLIEFYAVLYPYVSQRALNWSELDVVRLAPKSIIHCPGACCVAVTNFDVEIELGTVMKELSDLGPYPTAGHTRIRIIPDIQTHSGIRMTVATSQPSASGEEFRFLERGDLPSDSDSIIARQAIDGLDTLDSALAASITNLMSLFTICPRLPNMRKAGSVSSLPGWAWQDIDKTGDPVEEYCHLCVQLTHEFFHTKLYLLEKSVRLYEGTGNRPEVYSPWKNRLRPLRQVIHALLTFSAGAAVWKKLVGMIQTGAIASLADDYCQENSANAKNGRAGLIASGALTPSGIVLVDSIVEHLEAILHE